MVNIKRIKSKLGLDNSEVLKKTVYILFFMTITYMIGAFFIINLGGQPTQNAEANIVFDKNPNTNITVKTSVNLNADAIYVAEPEGNTDSGYASSDFGKRQASDVSSVGDSFTLEKGDDYASGDTITVIGILNGEKNIIGTYQV